MTEGRIRFLFRFHFVRGEESTCMGVGRANVRTGIYPTEEGIRRRHPFPSFDTLLVSRLVFHEQGLEGFELQSGHPRAKRRKGHGKMQSSLLLANTYIIITCGRIPRSLRYREWPPGVTGVTQDLVRSGEPSSPECVCVDCDNIYRHLWSGQGK